ncbi:MAG: hypothetical protein V7704_06140 [Aurantimonas endophytica]|uniref:hypothetical protein n=1 Tax=Aurantimonas endophytica TaxID=1522175 RepID=UPI003001863D
MKTIFATATAIALFAAPAFAQDAQQTKTTGATASPSSTTTSAEDKASQDKAMKSAEGAGMTNVAVVDRAFVLEGTNAAGNPVYMIVNPPGMLLGIGAPMATSAASQGKDAAATSSTGSSASESTAANDAGTDPATMSSTENSVEAMAGEPAKSGYMATQVNPATPDVWDPATVESRMRDMGLDKRAK